MFNDRLIVGVGNTASGAQIWVSDDGESFRQVVTGGMGDKNNVTIDALANLRDRVTVFQDRLYVGVANLSTGGEVWRTADGLQWERAADSGLDTSSNYLLLPQVVFQDRLYIVGWRGDYVGFAVYRTSDGTTWEKVGNDGFGVGDARNIRGELVEYKGDLYLTASNYGQWQLGPDQPVTHGFQLYKSTDGKQWTQVGEDGFGADTGITAGMLPFGEDAYLGVSDWHLGDQLWRSSDGTSWELMFQEPVQSWYGLGCGSIEFQGHMLWYDNDAQRGFEVWRTDEVVVAGATNTTLPSATTGGTTVTSSGGSTTTATTAGGGTGASGDDSQGGGEEGSRSRGDCPAGSWP